MSRSSVIFHSLADVRKDVNALLSDRFQYQHAQAANMHADYAVLWEMVSAQHEAGGKRMRPYLCVLAYEALGGNDYPAILPIAGGLELLHFAVLVHDDIIDRDFIRHNALNISGHYQQRYQQLAIDPDEQVHFANSSAILAGDLLLSDAYQMIAMSSFPAEQRITVMQLLGEAIYAVSGGELLDTEAALHDPTYVDSLKVAEFKTAVYSCSIPLAIGGLLAGANAKTQIELRHIGKCVGIAFQLADDLLGVFGASQQTGKTTIGDLREGKRTYLLQRTLHLASPTEVTTLNAIIGNPAISQAQAEMARAVMTACGAKAEVEQLMTDYAGSAEVAIQGLEISDTAKKLLSAFVQKAVWRTS